MIRIAACDGKPSFAGELGRILDIWADEKCLNIEFRCYESLNDLLTEIELRGHIDLVFLALCSENGGAEAAGRIRKEDGEAELVYVSEKSLCRRELFHLRPLDCLGYPLRMEEVLRLLYRYLKLRDKEKFVFRCRHRIIALAARQIRYLYHFNRKLYIYYCGDRYFETYMRMEEAELLLGKSETVFFRAHASYLVNLCFVEQLSCSLLLLYGGAEIPVGRPYGQQLMRYFEAYLKMRQRG